MEIWNYVQITASLTSQCAYAMMMHTETTLHPRTVNATVLNEQILSAWASVFYLNNAKWRIIVHILAVAFSFVIACVRHDDAHGDNTTPSHGKRNCTQWANFISMSICFLFEQCQVMPCCAYIGSKQWVVKWKFQNGNQVWSSIGGNNAFDQFVVIK
jgi:hypothetical protein